MADDSEKQLIEARRVIHMLLRVCRQILVFFDGVSALDKNRVQKLIRDAIRESDRFLTPR